MGGLSRPGLADLMRWGSLGQVPVAIVAGAALSWLSMHFEAAVEEVRTPAPAIPLSPRPAVAPPRIQMPRARLMLPIQVPAAPFPGEDRPESASRHARRLRPVLTAGVDWRPAGSHSSLANNFTPWVGGFGGGQLAVSAWYRAHSVEFIAVRGDPGVSKSVTRSCSL